MKQTTPLPPGGVIEYAEDVAKYALPPVPVGRYGLSVAYTVAGRRIESAQSEVSVVPPQVNHLATVSGPSEGTLALVLSHTKAGGEMAVFQRESRARSPDDGVAYQRLDVKPPAALGGVSVAIELDRNRRVRWFGWQEADAIGAEVAQDATSFVRVAPVPVGLRPAMLYPVGWQASAESATFVVLGQDTQDHVALGVATFRAEGGASLKTCPLALETLPGRWMVQRRGEDVRPRFDVVIAEEADGTVRLVRQTVKPDAQEAGSPTVLITRPGPLAALSLHPIREEGTGTVDALFGPAGEPAAMTFLRLPLEGGDPVATWTFTVSGEGEPKRNPGAWTLAPQPLAGPAVVVKAEGQLLCRRVAGAANWSVLAEHAAQAEHLRLEVIGGRVWAIWVDPAQGIQYKMIP
jgi:hypothetical protein